MQRFKTAVIAPFAAALVLSTALVAVPGTAMAQTGTENLDTKALDAELDKYWKPAEREVLRKSLYDKTDRHEFSIFFGVVPNDSFFSYIPLGGRWDFFFTEHFGIEVFGAYWVSLDGDLKSFLEENQLYPILTEFPQQLQWNASASIVWNPLHGKLAVFTTKLFHFDFHLSLGVGAIGTQLERSNGTTDSKVDVAGHLGVGLRFYVNDLIAIRADYKQFLYGAESGVAAPAEFTVGVSFWTN